MYSTSTNHPQLLGLTVFKSKLGTFSDNVDYQLKYDNPCNDGYDYYFYFNSFDALLDMEVGNMGLNYIIEEIFKNNDISIAQFLNKISDFVNDGDDKDLWHPESICLIVDIVYIQTYCEGIAEGDVMFYLNGIVDKKKGEIIKI